MTALWIVELVEAALIVALLWRLRRIVLRQAEQLTTLSTLHHNLLVLHERSDSSVAREDKMLHMLENEIDVHESLKQQHLESIRQNLRHGNVCVEILDMLHRDMQRRWPDTPTDERC